MAAACRRSPRPPGCRRDRSTITSRARKRLGAEIVDRYGEGTERRKTLRDRSLPPLKRLKRYFEELMLISVESNFERGCLLGNFSAEVSTQSPLIRERLDAIFVRWTKDIETAIADAQEAGLVATDLKAAVLASVVLDAYEGAVLPAPRWRKPAAARRLHESHLHQDLGAAGLRRGTFAPQLGYPNGPPDHIVQH